MITTAGVGMMEFLSTAVPTPIGVVLALGLLPTGDLLRVVTVVMDRYRPARSD